MHIQEKEKESEHIHNSTGLFDWYNKIIDREEMIADGALWG